MKRQGVFLLPLDGMLVHRRSLPYNLLGFPNNSPVSIWKLFGPVKPWQSLELHDYRAVPFIQEVSGIYTSPFLDEDELKITLQARKVSRAFEKWAPGLAPGPLAQGPLGHCASHFKRYVAGKYSYITCQNICLQDLCEATKYLV